MCELDMMYKDYCKLQNSYEQCKQFTVYKRMYTVHCIQSPVYSTLYFVDCIQYTVCIVKHSYSLHTFLLCVSYTQYDILYNVDCGLFTENCIQYTLDCVMYMFCVLGTASTRSLRIRRGTIVTCQYLANYGRQRKTL